MGFASEWLEKNALFPQLIVEAPERQTGIIVTIPACDEPDITDLLDCLADCYKPECETEILIVVNAPADATENTIVNNKLTIKNIESWKKMNHDCFFRLFSFTAGSTSFTKWGVGMARKSAMDEAVRRFSLIDNPSGIIVSLDADCRVEKNYLISIFKEFSEKKEMKACSIYFEHPLSGSGFAPDIYRFITLYELHLRYFILGLKHSGFPDVFQTVGSCMAVKALPYVRAGGMNRRQAGEDFYFIQKLVTAGGYFDLNSTTVYPSPRVSTRVPFGTGASIGKLAGGNMQTFLSYNIKAFAELKLMTSITGDLFKVEISEIADSYFSLPEGLRSYLSLQEWSEKLVEIKSNTSGIQSFTKRFFAWFNMFRTVKYMNHVHGTLFEKIPVEISSAKMLEFLGEELNSSDAIDILLKYRQLEKKRV